MQEGFYNPYKHTLTLRQSQTTPLIAILAVLAVLAILMEDSCFLLISICDAFMQMLFYVVKRPQPN